MSLFPRLLSLRPTSRVSGAAFLTVAQAVVIALGYVTHVLVGKIGGPPLYGVFGVVLSLVTIVNLPLSFGVTIATSKAVAEDPDNSGGVFLSALRLQLGLALLLSAGLFFFASPLARVLGDSSLAPLIRFASLIAPAQAAYAFLVNYFNGLHAFRAQAQLIILYALAKLGGSVGFLVTFRSVKAALSGFVTGGLLATFFGLPQTVASVRGHVRRLVPARRFFTLAGEFLGMSIALQVLMSLDLFLVKRLLHDNTLAGYYNAATTVARIPYFILQGLGSVFLPSMARLLKENLEEARVFLRAIFRYLFLLLIPVSALAATNSKLLLRLFYSSAYAPAAPSLTTLSVAFGFLTTFYLLATLAAGAGRSRVPLLVLILLIPLDVLLGLFCIPRFGLSGAAIMTLTTAAAGALFLLAYMIMQFRLTLPLVTLARAVMAAGIAVLPTYSITSVPTFLVPFWYVALFVLYLLALSALGELTRDDWRRLASAFPRQARANTSA